MSEDTPKVEEAIVALPEVMPVGESLVLRPVMNVAMALQQLKEFRQFVREYLNEGEDFGTIPGTPKPTLYKPGADKLCELYGLADDYQILSAVEKYDADPELFDYTVKCILTSRRDGKLVASGLGSCNSYEGKYKWREAKRICPTCQKPTIIKGQEQYGGGWICWKKKDGCGAKFLDGDKAIESQQAGKILNDDIPTIKNTVLKMAKKRAKIDATLAATRSSGIFTQDLEDMGHTEDPSDAYSTQEKQAAANKAGERQANDLKARMEARKTAPDATSGGTSSAISAMFYTLPNGDQPGSYALIVGPEGMLKLYKDLLLRIGKAQGHGKGVLVPIEKLADLQWQVEQQGFVLKKLEAR